MTHFTFDAEMVCTMCEESARVVVVSTFGPSPTNRISSVSSDELEAAGWLNMATVHWFCPSCRKAHVKGGGK
jgi:hypothetical protein